MLRAAACCVVSECVCDGVGGGVVVLVVPFPFMMFNIMASISNKRTL